MKKQYEVYIENIFNTEKNLQKEYSKEQMPFINILMKVAVEVMVSRMTIANKRVNEEEYNKFLGLFDNIKTTPFKML